MHQKKYILGWSSFNLFKLESFIPFYGSSIDTRINDVERTSAYKLIQKVLQGINFFPFEIDGNQRSTLEALRKFQEAINKKAADMEQDIIFKENQLGIFGYRTLESIRSEYRTSA